MKRLVMLTGLSVRLCCAVNCLSERMIDSLRAVVRSIDPQLRLTHVESMEQVVSEGRLHDASIRCWFHVSQWSQCCWRCLASTA